MNGWSSHLGADRWDDEPAWIYEITWEWEPVPGQRYPGDPGRRRRAVHIPVYEAARGDDVHGVGRVPADAATSSVRTRGSSPRRYGHRRSRAGEPSWNQPVPVPERLTDGRRSLRPRVLTGAPSRDGDRTRSRPIPGGA